MVDPRKSHGSILFINKNDRRNGIVLMRQSDNAIARIGMVNYLNLAPIHEKWIESKIPENWRLVEAPPSELNKKLSEGDIDLGFVSSFEYGAHPQNYKILSGLSISANGSVGSVFLFSHVPMEQLDDMPVLLSSQSETSVGLVKIILGQFLKVQPEYSTGNVSDFDESKYKAVLAIGDDALRMLEKSRFLYQFDLGDIWKRETGLPFVFAVCAVREEFCEQHSELVAEIHKELLRCSAEGKKDLASICTVAAPRIPMSEKRCYDYLTAIEYDLGGKKQKALETFFEYLIMCKEADPACLPLKLYSNLY